MSTISNERLEKLSSGNAWTCVQDDEAKAMATELLALRKERERAEPVAWLVCGSKTFKDRTASTREVAEQAVKDRKDGSCIKPLYTAPTAQEYPETLPCPVILEPNFRLGKGVRTATMLRALQTRAEHQAELDSMTPEGRADYEAGMAAFKAMLSSSSQTTLGKEIEQALKGNLHKLYLDDETDNSESLAQAETDTTEQQFESLAGKAVGSDGFECTPVADLYELLTKCGECYDYTTSAKVAADWINYGYSAREYVKLERLQEALLFAAPEPCK
ncbi:hypothetical protein ACN5OK_001442 [Cronobacter malonaticus]